MKGRETRTIAAIAFDCRSSITNLLVAATSEECCVKDFLNSRDVQQMRDRFNQWAANLGALQPFGSPLSLDHRLRDAPRVEESILYTLADLHSSIQAATDIALGRRPNRVITHPVAGSDVDLLEYGLSASDSDSSSVSSSDGETAPHNTSEIQELLSATRIGIDSLFKASIFVRKNASKDRRLRAATKDIFDNRADILHISDRYPLLKHNSTLVPRLGEANARRRQYFTYLRDHNERLAAVSDDSDNIEAQIHPGVVRAEAAMTVMTGETKPSLLADTAATPFVADEAAQDRILGIFAAPKAKSVVSFATSVAETSDKDLQFPPVPAEAKDPSFKCPYCGLPMELKDGPLKEDQWRKHIMQDLEPYICTFSLCSLDTFPTQRTWFEHELFVHRSQWVCPECSTIFGSSDDLKRHVSQNHSGLISKQQLPAFIEQSKRPVDSIPPSECPFCDDPWAQADAGVASSEEILVVSPEQFQRHLGKHLQQVALFSLPRQPVGDQRKSSDSMNGGGVPDQDDISETWNCLGHGWSIVSRKRTTFITLAYFLALYRAHSGYKGPLTLHAASLFDRVEVVQQLLDKGADINSRDRHHDTPLHVASAYGRERLTQLLLDRGADINSQDGHHETALQKASYNSREKMIRFLLAHGADVNVHDGRRGNALQMASHQGHLKAIEILLDHGVNVNLNVEAENYSSALQAAVYGGQERAIQLLLKHEAKINLEDERWKNVLSSAASFGHEKVFQLLLSQGVIVNSHFQRDYFANLLYSAAQRGQERVVQVLLDYGADINSEFERWGTPLSVAAFAGHEKMVQLLLDQGADINVQTKGTGSIMNSAACSGNEKVVQVILNHGLNVDARDERNGTALQMAAYRGRMQIVQFLLNKGANVNAQGGLENSALQAAACRGHDQVLELLLSHGADVNIQGGEYQSALQAAAYRGLDQIVELLLSHGADVNAQGGKFGNALQGAAYVGHDQIVELLLSHGADVHAQGGLYGNAFQAASSRGHETVKQRLLDSGADEKARGADYAFITVAVLGTYQNLLVRLSSPVRELKRRLMDDVPSILKTLKIKDIHSIRLVLDDRTLENEYQSCRNAGLREGSHILCHLENQQPTDVKA